MNELVTPPGYVEYPRDAKSLPLDDIGRLELALRADLHLRWAFALTCLAGTAIHSPAGIPKLSITILKVLLIVLTAVLLKLGCSKVLHARAWPEWLSPAASITSFCLALFCLYADRPYTAFDIVPIGFNTTVWLLALWGSDRIYKSVGFNYNRRLTNRRIDKTIEELRSANANGASSEIGKP